MPVPALRIDRTQKIRGTVVLLAICAVLVGLSVRLGYIQTAWGRELLAKAKRQQKSRSVIPARRGMILDATGRVVATSRLMWDVFVDPSLVRDVDELAATLSVRLGLEAEDIAGVLHRRRQGRYVVIVPRAGELEADAIRDLGHPAVGLTERGLRTHPLGSSMAHVLGFVGRDGQGLEGIELALNEHLRGRDGIRATIRDARRRALWPEGGAGSPPEDGGHVVLTLDAEIQRIVEQALQSGIERFDADSGVAIVMSPSTGELLAMACWPTFDVDQAAATPPRLRRNRAVTDPVEPGSTFKPFIASGALAEAVVSPTEKIDCHMGTWRFGRRRISDCSPHGLMTLEGIVSRSSNIGMAIIGERMGAKGLHRTLERFGFGKRTGVECPGEHGGIVYPLPRWNSYSVTSVPMGYEIGVTPLQMVTAFSAIINDGLVLQPRIVKGLLGPDGRVIDWADEPRVVRRALPVEAARYMSRVVLVSVVREGSGRKAKLDDYQVLGKTGTAKLSYEDRPGYEPGAYLASFMGAAPAGDPRVAVLVMIRRPNVAKGYYGGTVSAPVVREILAETLAYLQVPADQQVVARRR